MTNVIDSYNLMPNTDPINNLGSPDFCQDSPDFFVISQKSILISPDFSSILSNPGANFPFPYGQIIIS